MNRMKLGVACRVFDGNVKQALNHAAELGLAGVQIDARNEMRAQDVSNTGRRQFLHWLSERGLQVGSVTFPLRRRLHDPDQIQSNVDALAEQFVESTAADAEHVGLSDPKHGVQVR